MADSQKPEHFKMNVWREGTIIEGCVLVDKSGIWVA